MSATAELANVQEQRARAVARLDELEREARSSAQAATAASVALAEHERHGGAPAKRRELEQALATAKAKAGQPWSERVTGGRSAVRDCDVALRAFVTEHLRELVEAVEAEGRDAAARVDRALEELAAAHLAIEQVGQKLGAILGKVHHLGPTDVSRCQSDAVARDAAAMLASGGEQAPAVTRDRPPWSLLLAAGETAGEADAAPAEPVPA